MCVATNDAGVVERSVTLTLHSECLTVSGCSTFNYSVFVAVIDVIEARCSSRCTRNHCRTRGDGAGCRNHGCAQLSGGG